tara:strand:+ start:53 stop:463 length:411 start_codon:yes stop_codon:yes gene_type:complete
MKKFPHIKWYQDDTSIYIQILNSNKNPTLYKKNSYLQFYDDNYEFYVELFDIFTIDRSYIDKNDFIIVLIKEENKEWTALLKNRNEYKYFISLNWDKYVYNNNEINTQEPDDKFDEEEFKYLLDSGKLDEISSDED